MRVATGKPPDLKSGGFIASYTIIMRSNLAGCRMPAMVVYFLRQRLYNENKKHCAAIV